MDVLRFGIVTGSILLLSTVGFSMVWRSERFLNIAHGQLILLGAYVAYLFNVVFGWGILAAAIAAVLITALTGLLIAIFFYKPVRHYGELVLLFTSIGLAYVIYGLVQALAGTNVKAFNMSPSKVWTIGGQPIVTPHEFIIIMIAVICVVLLHLFLTKTKKGRGIRAMAGNRDLARIRGIHAEELSRYVWLISSGLAGLAGVLLAVNGSLHTEMGWIEILFILSAAVLGGLGGIYGTMIAAFIIGLSMEFSSLFISPSYRTAIAFLIIILVLSFKPQGLSKGGTA